MDSGRPMAADCACEVTTLLQPDRPAAGPWLLTVLVRSQQPPSLIGQWRPIAAVCSRKVTAVLFPDRPVVGLCLLAAF